MMNEQSVYLLAVTQIKMNDIWLNKAQFKQLVEDGEVETENGKIKLTDYVYSRVDRDEL